MSVSMQKDYLQLSRGYIDNLSIAGEVKKLVDLTSLVVTFELGLSRSLFHQR